MIKCENYDPVNYVTINNPMHVCAAILDVLSCH